MLLQRAVTPMSLALFAAAPLAAQSKTVAVDFGSPSFQTFPVPTVWNNVVSGLAGTHNLVDESGASSGFVLSFTSGLVFTKAMTSGVVTPTPGSPLALSGWPSSATRDALYSDLAKPLIELTLTGLDATATYDLTFLAAWLGVSDARAIHVDITAAQAPEAVLPTSNNSSELVTIPGLRPTGQGEIKLELSADRTNDNANDTFCLNALRIEEYPAGTQAPLVAFGVNRLDVSRKAGAGPYVASLSTYLNQIGLPVVGLSAIDTATGLPPTWLALPSGVLAGFPFSVTVDESALGVGSAEAVVTGQAGGYTSASMICSLVVRPTDGYKNLLFYGNSYTERNGGVGPLVREIAIDAGFEAPHVTQRTEGGVSLSYHKTNPAHVAAITAELPFGEEWDFAVMQGQSTEPTTTLGNPAAFVSAAIGILANVRAHSPKASACMFQTWARAQGHDYYPATFATPLAMHAQLEAGYQQAVSGLNAAYGPGTATRAAAGEAVLLQDFSPTIYESDLTHPRPALTVQTGMTITKVIYGQNACVMEPNFAGASALAQKLTGFGIDADAWKTYAGFADRVAAAGARVYPGSGEDFLLSTSVGGPVTACPQADVTAGATFTSLLESPAGTYVGAAAFYYFDLWVSGSPPGAWASYPEVQLGPATAFQLISTPALSSAGLPLLLPVSTSVAGLSVAVQGIVLGPSAKTGNPLFTTTDAHEIVMQ